MAKAFLIDGNYYVHRAWDICASNRNLDYLEKNVLTLLLSMVYGDAVKLKATHIAVSFDGPRSFRHDIYGAYKGNRSKDPIEVPTNAGY